MRCTIWYYLYYLKNVKNTYGRVLLLLKMQAEAWWIDELILRNVDRRKAFTPCFQPEPLSVILSIANLQHAQSSIYDG